MTKVALITGATRNLGFFLAKGLGARLGAGDVVYLTGRDPARVQESAELARGGRAEIRGEVLDVADRPSVERLARAIHQAHGGIDLVLSNHYRRVTPADDPANVIDAYVAANNLGTTNILRNFAPLLLDRGRLLVIASRAGSLRALAPALHPRFENRATLDDVDAAVLAWRDAVREGRAGGEAWPGWINIPSKIGQVAAVRALAQQRRTADLARGIMLCAISPGLIDTGASRPYFSDMSRAKSPEAAAELLLDFALADQLDTRYYGELVHLGKRSRPLRFKRRVRRDIAVEINNDN
ncbi:SDR family NAD(P)-dependent oxidoreductase [Bradyrhizobium sp. RDM4]|uniref:SDR family NAD(P)-dependent oxidoreductase n=1 Tax=Bradyrhizobium sp. RDM4 TaxID=3378765 RepID=UPI0038FC6C3C